MTEETYKAHIARTAQEAFRQPSLTYQDSQVFREIPGFDSILAIQFILAIETALDISLTEEEVDAMHTMGDLLAMVRAKKG